MTQAVSSHWNVLSLNQWQRYVRAVCDRAGLRLEWSDDGINATNGKTIWVSRPSWPMSEAEGAVVLSTTIHEASHVTHSDFEAGQALAKTEAATFQVWNIIEDDRIEYLPAMEWEGDRRAFNKTAPAMVEMFIESRVEGLAGSKGNPAVDPAMISLQEKLFAVGLWNCEARATTWAPAYTVTHLQGISPDVLVHVATLNSRPDFLRDLAACRPVADLQGSRDMLALARRIVEALGITPQEQDQAAAAMQAPGGMGKQGAGADAGDHTAMAKELGDGEGGAVKTDAKAKAGQAHPSKPTDEDGDPSELWSVERGEGTYTPLDPECIRTEDARDFDLNKTRRSELLADAERVKAQAGGLETLTGKVRRLLQIASQTLRTYGHKSGRLHGSALHRLAANVPGYSQRVFRRDETQLDLDCAVHLLIDASGSMGSTGKITQAVVAAETLSSCIGNVLGVPTMVSLFSTGRDAYHGEVPRNLIVRKFQERTVHSDTMLRRLSAAAGALGCNNNDAESVAWAIDELRTQRVARRFLIVLSDGIPASAVRGDVHKFLKEIVETAERVPDLEVHGIGIMSECVREFYKNCTVLHSADQIGECIMTLIGERMLKG